MRILLAIGATFCAGLLGLAGPAAAEKVCKDFVTAIGSASVVKGAAPKKARDAWSRAVTARYGEFWNDWSKAEGKDDQANCGQAYKYFHRCEARAKPCADGSGNSGASLATCASIGKSTRGGCDDLIVAAQSRLAEAGCKQGGVDGKEGRGTREAIRCYQRKNKLKVTGELNVETATALKLE